MKLCVGYEAQKYKLRPWGLYDPQQLPPDAFCECCQVELWGEEAEPDWFDRILCDECRHELARASNRRPDDGEDGGYVA